MKFRPAALAAALFVFSGAMPVWAMDALQVRSLAAACAGCHGTEGVAQAGHASLAGVSQEALLTQLMDFKTGQRPATLMHQIAKGYSDAQLGALAAYFSAQKNQQVQP